VIQFIPKHASHSSISAYTRCGKAYELRKVLKFPEPPAWYLIAGKAIHTATESLDEDPSGTTSPSQLFLDAFHDEIDKARAVWPDDSQWLAGGWGLNRQTYTHWFAKGQDYLERWASTELPGALVDIELDVSTVLPSGLEVKAYVDRLYQAAPTQWVIWDLKSGGSRPDSDQQLGVYTALTRKFIAEQYHEHPDRIKINAANYMFKDDLAYPVDVEHWNLSTVDRIGQAWVRGVTEGVFLPVRGKQCGSCGVAEACFLQSGDTPVTRLYDSLNPNWTTQ
jgi:CRISPR/Cas system-associated exonuclease Cas4 (RecB family)